MIIPWGKKGLNCSMGQFKLLLLGIKKKKLLPKAT
jgi:hypothetical protein